MDFQGRAPETCVTPEHLHNMGLWISTEEILNEGVQEGILVLTQHLVYANGTPVSSIMTCDMEASYNMVLFLRVAHRQGSKNSV